VACHWAQWNSPQRWIFDQRRLPASGKDGKRKSRLRGAGQPQSHRRRPSMATAKTNRLRRGQPSIMTAGDSTHRAGDGDAEHVSSFDPSCRECRSSKFTRFRNTLQRGTARRRHRQDHLGQAGVEDRVDRGPPTTAAPWRGSRSALSRWTVLVGGSAYDLKGENRPG